MASSGSSVVTVAKATNGEVAVQLKLSWTQRSQSIENNTSTIRLTLQVITKRYGAMYGSATQKWNIKVGGVTKKSGTFTIQQGSNSTKTLGYVDVTIKHASNGTGSFSASGYASFNMNFNAWVSSKTTSLSGTLNTIPRASSISVGTCTAGSQSTIKITRASSSFTHTIQYFFGSKSGTIATKTSSTSISWTPSMDLLNQIPNSVSGKGTLRCITYSGSTKIGQKDISFTLNAPSSVIPTIDSASIVLNNDGNDVVKSWGLCVQGYSRINVKASASGIYSSTISGFVISGGYNANTTGSSLDYIGSILNEPGKMVFNVSSKDSRGRYSSQLEAGTIEVVPYSPPIATSIVVRRSEEDVETIYVKANWSYSSVNGNNAVSVSLQYKEKKSDRWNPYGSIPQNSEVKLEGVFDEMKSYDFKIVITDSLSNSSQLETSISTNSVLLNFRAGGKGLGIGKIAEDDLLDCDIPALFRRDVVFNGDITVPDNLAFIKPTNLYPEGDSGEIDLVPFLKTNFKPYVTTPTSDEYPKARKYGSFVIVSGAVAPKTTIASSTSEVVFATLPEGFRPILRVIGVAQGSGINRWNFIIKPNGDMVLSRYGTDSYSNITSSNWLPFYAMFMSEYK